MEASFRNRETSEKGRERQGAFLYSKIVAQPTVVALADHDFDAALRVLAATRPISQLRAHILVASQYWWLDLLTSTGSYAIRRIGSNVNTLDINSSCDDCCDDGGKYGELHD